MNHRYDTRLNRRQWLLASTAALAACGGGGGGNLAGLPGTGGTGIGVQGTITGFGSVIVNGIKYDDSAAGVYLDGERLSSSDLRVGMVANINGSVDSGATSGRASRIDVWSIASGLLVPAALTASGFSMVGMQFSTDSATSFEGIANLAAISRDTPLAVWGVQASANALSWRATRVKVLLALPATIVSTGLLVASTQMLNGMRCLGPAVNGVADGQLLRVEGVLDSSTGVLVVSKATAMGVEQRIVSSGLVELEGVVTAFTNATHFVVGTVTVDASTAVVSGASQTLGENSAVEVRGRMQNGVLIASQLDIQGGSSAVKVDITGLVQSFGGLNEFEVRGQECDASKAKVLSGSVANLHKGTKVRVRGTRDGDETLLIEEIYVDVP